jgi:hypothetical protein
MTIWVSAVKGGFLSIGAEYIRVPTTTPAASL